MLKAKTLNNSIALIKLKVTYRIGDDYYLAESELTPLEFDGNEYLVDQFDWFDLAVKMIGVNLLEFEPEEFEQFKESLDVQLMHDERLNVSLN